MEICKDSILISQASWLAFQFCNIFLIDGSSAVLIISSNLLAIYDISQFKMRPVDPVYTESST